MANKDSPSFSLGISQIETQKAIHDSNQIVGFTPGSFDYTKLGFSENRSKQQNNPEKLKILREAFAAKNQNVSLLVKKRSSHNVRIGSAHNINVVDRLNEVMNDEGIRMFRSTCFGSFLDLPNCNFQGSFAIVTGLKCQGSVDDSEYSGLPPCRLQKKYFPNSSSCVKRDKINIPARHFHMVDDGSYSSFSWGKVAFEKFMASISRSMNEVQKFYRLSDLSYALQIWWYECCAKVDESLAVHVHNLIPRMLVYRNITPLPQELSHLDLPNPLIVGSTDNDANVAQAVAVQQQSERTAPTEFEDEFDDFSTPPGVGLLKKMRLDIDSSIDRSEPRVSLDKDKVVPNIEMRDADKTPAASEEKLSLSKSDLDEIKSYVRTYVDMKFNDLQKLMVDQYTGLLGVVKEGFALFDKVAQYPVHESEKGNPNIEVDPPQSVNEHTTDAKSYNIVDVAGQSSKLGVNEGAIEEALKEAESSYAEKLQKDDRHITDAEVVEAIMKERVRESEEALHNTDEYLSEPITLYVPPSRATYPTGINYEDAATIDTCDRQGNIDSQFYISDNDIAAISQVPVCKTNLKYVRKLTSKRNRKPLKVYQSSFVSVFDSESKDKEVIQSHKKLKYLLEGHNINGPYAEDLFSKFSVWMSVGLKGKDEYYTAKHTDLKPTLDFVVAHRVKKIGFITWRNQVIVGMMRDCGLFAAAYAEFLSDRHQIPSSEFDSKKHRTRYASLLWDYGVNKACIEYVSNNQDPPRPKRTFIRSEDTEMIDVEP
ncbi:uncharacterized protein LOC124899647 [Capsicum annuum]|uniref:uncharacterized protein LOC124899647 n=1 Tax=Capsicum annuum TaxID=4072 RepID=UPI001FB12199|nr:uncharacterized protein LOC124899647 [Capsicum annuum]